jgi:hypothetical protein
VSFILNGSRSSDNVGVVRYIWSFKTDEGEAELEGMEVEIAIHRPGEYIITLVAHDAAGNTGNDTVIVTVIDPGDDDGRGLGLLLTVLAILAPGSIIASVILLIIRRRSGPDPWGEE